MPTRHAATSAAEIPAQHKPRRGVRAALTVLLSLSVAGGIALADAGPAAAADQTVSLAPKAMSFTNSVAAGTSFDTLDELAVSKSQYQSYLKYEIPATVANATIVSAQLDLAVNRSVATKAGLEVRATSADWTGPSLTFASKPSVSAQVLNQADTSVPAANTRISTKLRGLVGTTVPPVISFQIAYNLPYTEIRLSKTQAPVLKLVTAAPGGLAGPTTNVSTPPQSSDELPYVVAPAASTKKKVFAHYFPPYPISIDNKATASDYYARNYLNPAGEGGKFRSVGGLLRDRPPGRAVLTGDYKMADSVTEVQQASAAGVDGFMVNIMGWSGNSWDASLRLAEASARSKTGFVTVPNVDMTAAAGAVNPVEMAARLATFYQSRGTYRLPDGRYMLSIYKAEAKPVTYWRQLITQLKTVHGIDVAWVGVFHSLSDASIKEYAPISYALGTWGVRNAAATLRMPDRAADVHKLGVKWMAPIAVQDVRHHHLSFAEASNTELLRASWTKAIDDDADLAQLVTWNDYSESTHFARSAAHGDAFLDVNGYYQTQFKSGKVPTMTGDELVVTHRVQKVGTQPKLQTAPMDPTLAGSKTAPRDTVELLSFLKAPASLTLTVGTTTKTVNAPAGVSSFTLPLVEGTVSATATRRSPIATLTSPHKVVPTTDYWNLQYYAATSRRS